MKIQTKQVLVLAAVAVMVGFYNPAAKAQGNFDPAQMRQRQVDNARERMEVKSDEDWKKIEPLIGKVFDAQREARMGLGGFGGFGGGRGGRGGRGPGGGGDNADGGNNNNNRARVGGRPGPEA